MGHDWELCEICRKVFNIDNQDKIFYYCYIMCEDCGGNSNKHKLKKIKSLIKIRNVFEYKIFMIINDGFKTTQSYHDENDKLFLKIWNKLKILES